MIDRSPDCYSIQLCKIDSRSIHGDGDSWDER